MKPLFPPSLRTSFSSSTARKLLAASACGLALSLTGACSDDAQPAAPADNCSDGGHGGGASTGGGSAGGGGGGGATLAGPLTSISAMEFGPDNTLFVADPSAGVIYALDTGGTGPQNEDGHFNLYNADRLIASHLGLDKDTLSFGAVAVHPQTAEVFVAVTQHTETADHAAVVKVSTAGEVVSVDAGDAPQIALSDPISEEVTFWGKESARTLAVTDMDYDEGFLYVAGLSNADFASTLYKIPYPFDGSQVTSSVGIYHAIHGQTETRAPIRTQAIVELSGVKHLLAAYTCTPLVAIPLSDIQDGAHITGKTIAELGHGNTPLDIMQLSYQDAFTMEQHDVVVLTNQQRATMVMSLADIEAAVALPGLSTPTLHTAGVPFTTIPLDANVLRIKPQGSSRVVSLRRNLHNGNLDLLSLHQGVWMRLSEFVAEYEFPNWGCPPGQEYITPFSTWLAGEEGIDLTAIDTGRLCN